MCFILILLMYFSHVEAFKASKPISPQVLYNTPLFSLSLIF